ncbi:hypothetical protein OB905_10450 [Halobacteria archaeon AArc-dxtr1]|nr:hypothetical protein [Halobacteria archaeon AArc-dxtr1]
MISRRNTLVGIGSLVAGGGAVLATGAFSTVEAERSVNIETAGDGSALLQIVANDGDFDGVDDTGGDTVELSFNSINIEATTGFDDLLTVTNNGDQDVDLHVENSDGEDTLSDGEVTLNFENDNSSVHGGGNSVEVISGGSVELSLDLVVGDASDEEDFNIDVTFVANAQEE